MHLQRVLGVIKLDECVMDELVKDKNSVRATVWVVLITGLIVGFFSTLIPSLLNGSFFMALLAAIPSAIVFLISFSIICGILHLISLLFGGKGTYRDMFVVLGHGFGLNVLSWIPMINVLLWLWSIVINAKVISHVHRMSAGKAVLVVILPLILVFILAIALVALLGMAVIGALLGLSAGALT